MNYYYYYYYYYYYCNFHVYINIAGSTINIVTYYCTTWVWNLTSDPEQRTRLKVFNSAISMTEMDSDCANERSFSNNTYVYFSANLQCLKVRNIILTSESGNRIDVVYNRQSQHFVFKIGVYWNIVIFQKTPIFETKIYNWRLYRILVINRTEYIT
jgi:hypothetical protein